MQKTGKHGGTGCRSIMQKNRAYGLSITKRIVVKRRVSYDDAVEEALCFGWIDSIMKPIDEEKYMQKFTPRKIKSVWSALNKKRVEKLLEQKLMTPAGMAIIETGKKNGSWVQLDHVENFIVPPDLKKFFAKNKKVLKYFEGPGKIQAETMVV